MAMLKACFKKKICTIRYYIVGSGQRINIVQAILAAVDFEVTKRGTVSYM